MTPADTTDSSDRSATLAGKTILVTRPADQAADLVRLFEALGAETLLQPAAMITPPDNIDLLDETLRAFAGGKFHWAVFSSANGVRAAFDRLALLRGGKDAETAEPVRASGVRIAVVGSGTAKALAAYGLEPDLIPEKFDAEGVVDALDALNPDYAATRILSFRANRGRQTLADALRERGADYREVVAYKSVDVTTPNPDALDALRAGRIDAAVVTSSASAKALVNLFGADAHKTRWAAISPLTADAMEKLGVRVDAIADEASMPSLADAVARMLR